MALQPAVLLGCSVLHCAWSLALEPTRSWPLSRNPSPCCAVSVAVLLDWCSLFLSFLHGEVTDSLHPQFSANQHSDSLDAQEALDIWRLKSRTTGWEYHPLLLWYRQLLRTTVKWSCGGQDSWVFANSIFLSLLGCLDFQALLSPTLRSSKPVEPTSILFLYDLPELNFLRTYFLEKQPYLYFWGLSSLCSECSSSLAKANFCGIFTTTWVTVCLMEFNKEVALSIITERLRNSI